MAKAHPELCDGSEKYCFFSRKVYADGDFCKGQGCGVWSPHIIQGSGAEGQLCILCFYKHVNQTGKLCSFQGCQDHMAEVRDNFAKGMIDLRTATKLVPTQGPLIPTMPIVAGSSTTMPPPPEICDAAESPTTMGPGLPLGPGVVGETHRRIVTLETEVEELRTLLNRLKEKLESQAQKIEKFETQSGQKPWGWTAGGDGENWLEEC